MHDLALISVVQGNVRLDDLVHQDHCSGRGTECKYWGRAPRLVDWDDTRHPRRAIDERQRRSHPTQRTANEARRYGSGEAQPANRGADVSEQSRSGPSDSPQRAIDLLPSVSLPKGGGAIRGIGKKFSLEPCYTDTAAMSDPARR